MIDQRLYEEFRDIGRDIFVTGLTSSHGGNMSVRVGDKIIIKRPVRTSETLRFRGNQLSGKR